MNFSDLIKKSLNKAKFAVNASKRNSSNPWWNSDCSRDYRLRKAAWRKLLYNQCPKNWRDYKYAAAVFKRTVATAKDCHDNQRSEFLSKPGNRKPLFNFLKAKKVIPSPINIKSVVSTPSELSSFLENIAKGLESRFTAACSFQSRSPVKSDDFEEVTASELAQVVKILPNAAPGPDGITASVIKIVHKVSPQDLLAIVNHSIRNSWIPPEWRMAKIIPLLKKHGAGFTLENIRPISLTSNMVKLIERILHIRIENWLNENMILSPCEI